jgi:hypothetical protein
MCAFFAVGCGDSSEELCEEFESACGDENTQMSCNDAGNLSSEEKDQIRCVIDACKGNGTMSDCMSGSGG